MVGLHGWLEAWMRVLAANSVLAVVVFAVVLVATRVAKRGNPSFHVALWGLVLVRLVLPPDLGHPFAAGSLIERAFPHDLEAIAPVQPPLHEALFDSGGVSPAVGRAVGSHSGPWKVAGWLWLTGFLAVAVLQLRRRRAVQKVLAAALPVVDGDVLAACERWRSRLGIRRRVAVVTSPAGLTPFTVGLIRPVIYLPQAALGDPGCTEAAMAHEMAHVSRFDALWLDLQHILQSVYFFNPIVWITGVLIVEAREQLCDATVVAADRLAARDYVGGLLHVLRFELQGVGAPTMAARKRRLVVRIRNIFKREGAPGPRVVGPVVAAAVVGLFLLPFGTSGADTPPEPAVVATGQTAPETADPMSLVNPLPDGRVTWDWGPGHRDPFTGEEVTHRGIDLAAGSGTPVISPADGVVRVATENYEPSAAAGTVVIIEHGDGLSTFFAHLESLEVVEGESVQQGAVIATVGSTGKSTGSHLHFEVRRDGEAVNPAEFVVEWQAAR